MRLVRLFQVIKYGWRHAGVITAGNRINQRVLVFLDILRCFRKYHMWSNQYVKEHFYELGLEERERIGGLYKEKNDKYERVIRDKLYNRVFLKKWKSYFWELGYERRRKKRQAAYAKRYNMGENCDISFDVHIERNHNLEGSISIGNNVMLSKHVYIDYSGEVVIEDDVKVSSSVVIESHRHEFVPGLNKYDAIPTSVLIEKGVWIGQHALICESTKRIGRFAQIGAGAVVRTSVPPYAIVVGNPAKVIGFVLSPQEVELFETNHDIENPLDIEKYKLVYEKYFINRIKEIKQVTRL